MRLSSGHIVVDDLANVKSKRKRDMLVFGCNSWYTGCSSCQSHTIESRFDAAPRSLCHAALAAILNDTEIFMQQSISLVPMTPAMYHAYFKEYQNDPDLYVDPATYQPYCYSEERVEQYIQRQRDRYRLTFAIVYGDEMVGELLLKNIEPHVCATLGIAMKNTQYKDRGFGTQAERLAIDYVFHVLDIPVLYADAILSNTRSQHVLEKVGFRLIREDAQFRYYAVYKTN